jgi:aminoglycoside 3-N-acetyltransferase I
MRGSPAWHDSGMSGLEARRLGRGDRTAARDMFALMADVFGEGSESLGDDYIDRLLGCETFWAFAAFVGPDIVGGLTAHTLPMTRSASSEVFIYDLAVRQTHQRQGVGSRLVRALREAAARAGINEIFVPADNDDEHALDFYRAQGAIASPVTFFTFSTR